MPQNLNKPITSTIYSQKRTTKETELSVEIFDGLDHILLKRCYRARIIWYAKLAPRKRKFSIECDYANSHPATPYRTYQSHHVNGNQTRKLSLNMTIYMSEHGSVNLTSQYLIAIIKIWQHLVHRSYNTIRTSS